MKNVLKYSIPELIVDRKASMYCRHGTAASLGSDTTICESGGKADFIGHVSGCRNGAGDAHGGADGTLIERCMDGNVITVANHCDGGAGYSSGTWFNPAGSCAEGSGPDT